MSKKLIYILILVALGLILFSAYSIIKLDILAEKKSLSGSYEIEDKVQIGGDFTALATNGKEVNQDYFKGKFSLFYFGFTYCPDICPAGLQIISDSLRKLGKDANKIQAVFVTVDPERDDVDQLRDYLANFGDNILGLTGNEDQIKNITTKFKIYYEKYSDNGDNENYMVNHSSFIYLMGPNMEYITHFGPSERSEDIAKEIERRMIPSTAFKLSNLIYLDSCLRMYNSTFTHTRFQIKSLI